VAERGVGSDRSVRRQRAKARRRDAPASRPRPWSRYRDSADGRSGCRADAPRAGSRHDVGHRGLRHATFARRDGRVRRGSGRGPAAIYGSRRPLARRRNAATPARRLVVGCIGVSAYARRLHDLRPAALSGRLRERGGRRTRLAPPDVRHRAAHHASRLAGERRLALRRGSIRRARLRAAQRAERDAGAGLVG
jgi:hypothetical protein